MLRPETKNSDPIAHKIMSLQCLPRVFATEFQNLQRVQETTFITLQNMFENWVFKHEARITNKG